MSYRETIREAANELRDDRDFAYELAGSFGVALSGPLAALLASCASSPSQTIQAQAAEVAKVVLSG